jgi:hypothetical protein
VPHFLAPTHKVACVEASTEVLQILQESKENHLKESQQVASPGSTHDILSITFFPI